MQPIEVSTPMWQLVISVLAIIIAPIAALQISKILEVRKAIRERKFYIFRTLMMTRATKLSVEHVSSLNMIDVEFYGKEKKNSDVVEAWKVYLDALNNQDLHDNHYDVWIDKIDVLFIELMQKMATCLKYDFDKSILKKTSYYPQGHITNENEIAVIRGELSKIVKGEKAFPVIVTEQRVQKKDQNKKDIAKK